MVLGKPQWIICFIKLSYGLWKKKQIILIYNYEDISYNAYKSIMNGSTKYLQAYQCVIIKLIFAEL